jgi:hypothetical protein
VKEIETLKQAVEKALESENVNALKAANAALDEGTVKLADFLMDLAMEAQLRKKGLLEGPSPSDIVPLPAPSGEKMAPTGTEGTIPLRGEKG